jgi:deoxyribose-phosphate aldolase
MLPIASYIDHTLLKPTAKSEDIIQLCKEAIRYNIKAVCVSGNYIALAKESLANANVIIASVIGFPFGYNSTASKLIEVQEAISLGAKELDVVHNICAVKNKQWNFLRDEAQAIIELAHQHQCIVKIIIESGELTNEEMIACCKIYAALNVDFIKTSLGPRGMDKLMVSESGLNAIIMLKTSL